MKIYIAGKMRGVPEWNFPAFDAAEERIRARGWHPFSPAQTCRAMGYDHPDEPVTPEHLRHVMSVDIAAIYAADAIALLPGWETSTGATVELALAQFIGLAILDAVTLKPISPPSKPWADVYRTLANRIGA